MQLILLTFLTMIAFAANSVFARLAVADGAADAATYSLVRLVSGALVLGILATNVLRQTDKSIPKQVSGRRIMNNGGNWVSSFALLVYITGFSFAYLALETGMGALILFACVQATMIGWGIAHGSRPSPLEWLGLVIAFGAFIYLVSPGLTAPDPAGSVLMIAAGIGWGAYSLRAKSAAPPLLETAGNFVRASIMIGAGFLVFYIVMAFAAPNQWLPKMTGFGLAMALLSGGLTSGLGYALWYRCLIDLTSTKAAIVQLSVPALATLGGVWFAGEILTPRLLFSSIAILGGVALAISAKSRAA